MNYPTVQKTYANEIDLTRSYFTCKKHVDFRGMHDEIKKINNGLIAARGNIEIKRYFNNDNFILNI
ncbi:UNVERIFIED_CONTAM: hypothetical protein O8I53_06115 [Campylobacter lari]